MDSGMIVIGIVSVLICALPIILTNRSRNKRTKLHLALLKEKAKDQNCEITQHEIGDTYSIGIDENRNCLFFLAINKGVVRDQFVDLYTIGDSKIANISRPISGNDKIIDSLSLQLSPRLKKQATIVLEFYNSEVSFQLGGEIKSLEKWNVVINDLLKKKVVLKAKLSA
jgi:hypothetical protein